MLLSFRTSNYRSIRDEVELTMRHAPRMSPHTERSAEDDETAHVNHIAAIYGNNASGKSNLLAALRAMSSMVSGSGRKGRLAEAYEPFRLDDHSTTEPTLMEVEIRIDGVRYQYGFMFDSRTIINEWLYAYPYGRRQIWFERSPSEDGKGYRFGKFLAGRNRIIADLTRLDALFLSTAANMNHGQLNQIFEWFSSSLIAVDANSQAGRLAATLENLHQNPTNQHALLHLLQFSDLGIQDMEVTEEEIEPNLREKLHDAMKILLTDSEGERLTEALDSPNLKIQLKHSRGDGGPLVALPFESESLGTRSMVALGGVVLNALALGQVLVVDEIDSSLHPRLVSELIRLFQSADFNQNDAQLIFTSHDAAQLSGAGADDPVLLRDQIWFTEKKSDGATALYPLTDFHPRKLENLERGYLQGRYGAVPFLDREVLENLPRASIS